MGKTDLDRYSAGDVHLGVKIGSPSVEVESSGVHEVWAIPEDEIAIFHRFEKEGEETPPAESYCNLPLDHCVPVPFYPALDCARRGP